jgi:hypothetical protein
MPAAFQELGMLSLFERFMFIVIAKIMGDGPSTLENRGSEASTRMREASVVESLILRKVAPKLYG